MQRTKECLQAEIHRVELHVAVSKTFCFPMSELPQCMSDPGCGATPPFTIHAQDILKLNGLRCRIMVPNTMLYLTSH